ncbi:ribonuclease T2 family protein [Sphingomonas vulcanisoli]|nr:ribonuclease T [Sphingomonas vulcanisoli]
MFLRAVIVMLGWLILPAAAMAQGAVRPMAADLGTPHIETPHGGDMPRTVPIGGYTLATFWVPQHCKQAIRGIAALDCARPEVRTSGLALHGLWPDGEGKEWPQWCKPAALLSSATIAGHLGAIPSAQQMQHEWAKHGTCMAGMTPERYFDHAEQLYRAIHIPDLRALSYKPQTVASVKRAIAEANPGLQPDMFKLTMDKAGWLQEIWFCLDTKFARKTCAEPQREPEDAKLLIWRGGRSAAANGSRYRSSYDGARSRNTYSRPRYRNGQS